MYLFELCIPVAATATRSHLHSAVQGNLVISYCSAGQSDMDKEALHIPGNPGMLYGTHFH